MTTSRWPRYEAMEIALLFMAGGSTRGSASSSLTTSVWPFVEASRIARLYISDGSTRGSASNSLTTSVWPYSEASWIASLFSTDGSTLGSVRRIQMISTCLIRHARPNRYFGVHIQADLSSTGNETIASRIPRRDLQLKIVRGRIS